MGGQSRGPVEPYTYHFMTAVEAVDGTDVVLEETYFYPEGGGQPADRGSIDGVSVSDVQTVDGEVVHTLDTEPGFGPGDFVSGSVEESFRRYCMRAHTASHALYGAGRRLFEDLGYGGFDISPQKVRVDFETPTDIDDDTLVELERLVNRVVWDDRSVDWEAIPRADALAREDVAFNSATEEGLTDETVRLVEIDGWDVAACGGTHVRSTSEIGPVTVLSRSNPGDGLTRVEFTVGPEAIQARARQRRAASAAARALDSSLTDLPEAVERLREERDAAVAEREELREQYVDAQVDALAPVQADDATWLVGVVEGLDANGLADRAQALAGQTADVVVLVHAEGSALAVATTGERDAQSLVARATEAFGGGGGGSKTVAQGGGLDASATAIADLFP